MKSMLRVGGRIALAGLLLLGGLFALGWWKTERDLRVVYAIEDAPLPVLSADQIARDGKHLYLTRGCADCHGERGEGLLVFDAGPVIRVSAPNLTPAGLADRYDADALGRAVRHAVRHDGTPLVFMPSGDFAELSDHDTALLAGYMLTLPPIAALPEPIEIRPLGRLLHLLGLFPLLPAQSIDHGARVRSAPAIAATPQYGFYLAQVCTGCHGDDFAGLQVGPPSAPRGADLRPGAAMDGWNEADFIRAMREGLRPDGSAIDPFMPWKAVGRMTDTELSALWQYFQTLPPAGR